MFVFEFFVLALNNLRRSKLRTTFTIIGIAIGASAVLAMVSFGVGLQKEVTKNIASGANFQVLDVMPGYDFSSQGSMQINRAPDFPLTDHAIDEIKRIKGVKAVTLVIEIH